jgi:hypothetical protein
LRYSAAALRSRKAPGVTRRSVPRHVANDPDLAAMRRAVAAMKALPQSDARNWIRFADIHRNFCPHGNWYFLPWHRAYIASFERICQELSGKRDFALPYWNWTVDRQFPAAFAAGDRSFQPVVSPAPRCRAAAPRRGHGRPGGDLADHEQSGLRSVRLDAAARPEQRGGDMAAPARLQDRA